LDDDATPLISVIVPVKNGGRYIAETIESVLHQDYERVEIIVVDERSTDDTAQLVQRYSGVRYVLQEGAPGIAASRNLGIDVSRGEFIAFISSDDFWVPRKLRLQAEMLCEQPDVQYVLTRVKFFLQEGQEIPDGFRRELLEGDYVGPMPETLLARRSLFDRIGRFDSSLTLLEDSDWFLRAKDAKIPMGIVDQVLLHKRVHRSNISLLPSNKSLIRSEFLRMMKLSIDRKRSSSQK
jgi:glycosyltransferase involved in cell wall biosynthesis